jgi:4-amino-4-deoxy-L-arabinose transferase-like glycosyltransferase
MGGARVTPVGAAEGSRLDIWRLALLVIAGLTLLRLVFLLVTPIELDFEEAQYWAWSRTPAWGYFSKPPLIAWLIRAATAICGNGPACVRAPSPLFHAATAVLIGATGIALGGRRLGAWASLVYATMPGVAFSAMLMTTDVPLTLFWALTLYCLVRLGQGGGLGWAVAGGVALGLGALSKYAMLLFIPGAFLYLLLSPEGRRALGWQKPLAMLVVALAVFSPNLLWNLNTHWTTVVSTAETADVGHPGFELGHVLEYVGGQLAIFGPVPLYLLFEQAFARKRSGAGAPNVSLLAADGRRLVLCLSLPFLLGFLLLSMTARANANWAAYAYVGGSLAVAGVMAKPVAYWWLRRSVVLHAAIGLAMYGAILCLPLWTRLPFNLSHAVERRIGWQSLGQTVAAELAKEPSARLLTADRALTSDLLYHAQVPPNGYAAWSPDPRPSSEYERMARLKPGDPGPFLLVLPGEVDAREIVRHFSSVEPLDGVTVHLWTGSERRFQLIRLQGFRDYAP